MNATELEALVVQLGRRLAALESEVAALKGNGLRKFAQASPAPASQSAEPEGVRIIYPVARATIAMPNAAELQKLLDVVLAKYPKLRPYSPGDRFADQDAANFWREFEAAFQYVAQLGRTDEVDSKRGLTWWAGEATEWCRLRNTPIDISSSPLLAAVIASGDVDFIERDEWGNVWAFALATVGGRPPAADAWRGVLKGKLRVPLPGRHKAADMPSVRFEGATV